MNQKSKSECNKAMERCLPEEPVENGVLLNVCANDNYHDMNIKQMKLVYTHGNDGLTDTVGQLLQSFTLYDRVILKLLLLPF